MMSTKTANVRKKENKKSELSIEEKLRLLYTLQQVDSNIDNIKILRGELPLEVQDLEDEVAGLETRLNRTEEDVKNLENEITVKKNEIKEAETLIKKYETQQMNVRNNREFDSLSKEIEYQNLEIELYNKKIKEFTKSIDEKKETKEKSEQLLGERSGDLTSKKEELDSIIAETQKEESKLVDQSKEIELQIEPRLLTAYKRIRANAHNGLAVVAVQRGACGGCFNKIPPQRQLDIKTHKKIIVCEYCGRILVDEEISENETK